MKQEKISEIRARHHNEWLRIAVDEVDPETQEPLSGHLLAHGPHRQDIHKSSAEFSGPAYVVYSEDWPDDLAACFQLS